MHIDDKVIALKTHILAERDARRRAIDADGTMLPPQKTRARNELIGPGLGDSMLPRDILIAKNLLGREWKTDKAGNMSLTLDAPLSPKVDKALCQIIAAELFATGALTSFLPGSGGAIVKHTEDFSATDGYRTTFSVSAEIAPHLRNVQTELRESRQRQVKS